jgi:S-DNA-T family DNA segregation ATPase FtsK/SpoIIIE
MTDDGPPQRCDECGFDYASVPAGQVPSRLRAFGPAYATALARVPDVRRRPAAQTWSALEYACHVRDVFRIQLLRLELALREDEPTFASMGRDELAVSSRYNSQEPKLVLAGLAGAADALAAVFGELGAAQLDRVGAYPWGAATVVRSMRWLGQHTVHEGVHHLLDIERQVGGAA